MSTLTLNRWLKEKFGNKEFEALFEKGKIDGVSEEIVQNSQA